jgi:hypothetical protein
MPSPDHVINQVDDDLSAAVGDCEFLEHVLTLFIRLPPALLAAKNHLHNFMKLLACPWQLDPLISGRIGQCSFQERKDALPWEHEARDVSARA